MKNEANEAVETQEIEIAPEEQSGDTAPAPEEKDWRANLRERADAIEEKTIKDVKPRRKEPKAKTVETTEPVEPVETRDEPSEPKAAAEPTEPTVKTESIAPPVFWKKEQRDQFAKASPELQKIILENEEQRIKHYNQRNEDLAKQRKHIESFEQILGPERDRLRIQGISEPAYIQALVAADNLLRKNPQQGLEYLKQVYGLSQQDVSSMQPVQQPHQQQLARDPAVDQLRAELEAMRAEKLNEEIRSFARANPFFADVREEMGQLLQSGAVTTLDEAYQVAVLRNPETRQAYLQTQQPSPQTNQIAVESAKRAAAVAPRARGTIDGQQAGLSWRDSLHLNAKKYEGVV